jgi:small subunit ribosomal protein S16
LSVRIRLKRMGAKKKPFYRIVVADSASPRNGRFVEEIGYYNPKTTPITLKVDTEKAQKWIALGAQPSDTVKRLLTKAALAQEQGPDKE